MSHNLSAAFPHANDSQLAPPSPIHTLSNRNSLNFCSREKVREGERGRGVTFGASVYTRLSYTQFK